MEPHSKGIEVKLPIKSVAQRKLEEALKKREEEGTLKVKKKKAKNGTDKPNKKH